MQVLLPKGLSMKTKLLLLTILLSSQMGISQSIEEKLDKWAITHPTEKLYVQTDKNYYYAGETVWLKGYLLQNFLPSLQSSNLLVALISPTNEKIVSAVFPAFGGYSNGQIDLPDTLTGNTYLLKAYTPTMLNQPDFIFTKLIHVVGKKNIALAKENTLHLTVQFFPEGGNFVTGVINNIAFKATDQIGMPIKIEGQLKNDKNELVAEVKTVHDGMGIFSLIPLKDERYYLTIAGKDFPLPSSTTNGAAIAMSKHPKGKAFRIDYSSEDALMQPAFIVGQMNNQIVFSKPINATSHPISGILPIDNLLSGILHITIFNKDYIPLAERLVFINNKEYLLSGSMAIDSLNTDPKQINQFSLTLKDTVLGSFSASVVDADLYVSDNSSSNIISHFLLASDLKGYIHNPGFYFSNNADLTQKALDLVMLTNGWSRFNWKKLEGNQSFTKDPGYKTLSGQALLEGSKKPFANKDLFIYIKSEDSVKRMQLVHTDANGYFRLDFVILFGKNAIMFSDTKGKKSKYITVKLNKDDNIIFEPAHNSNHFSTYPLSAKTTSDQIFINNYAEYSKAAGMMLDNVTVKTKKKSPIKELEEKYASPLFASDFNSKSYDLTNEVITDLTIFDYLRYRVPGFDVSSENGEYSVSYRGSGGQMTLFLDEIETDANMISSIPPNQIALVKVFSHFIGAAGAGSNGVLAIYTKKGADLNAVLDAPTDVLQYNGYSIVKEFYSPNYSVKKIKLPDYRSTLLWVPNINIGSVNPTIPIKFYNNNKTTKFKIVVEGITLDGKFLYIEKIVGQ